MTSTAVRVGLRVRPLTEKERINNCTECLTFIPNEPQILIGTDKSFTYDYVFNSNADQAQVYLDAASPLLHKFVDGFNATILAYGQTGSGKTFSMGTSLDNSVSAENEGIVPRCIIELFQILKSREAQDSEFKSEIYVSFLELYNEEFIDLLNNPQQSKRRSTSYANTNTNNYNNPNEVSVREDVAGNIYWSGVKEEICYSPEELLGFLAQGSLGRTTGSTEMNSVSSRSHAIFSVILKQHRSENEDGKIVIKSLNSKFHFVDLAGSERLKRTHAQGDRAKEGIAINSGLLALGNVISALGDEGRRATHIPYRDSKLTRLLQDSLGGNSQTLMLACVSPADTNFMETLNTLKYANRARNIKNRVTVNQDFAGSSMEVNQLKSLVSRLRIEIASLRADGSASTTTNTSASAAISIEDKSLRHESVLLRERLQEMQSQIIQVTSERDTLLMERELGEFMQNDDIDSGDSLLENISSTTRPIKTHPIIEKYQRTIQELTHQLDDTKDKLLILESTQPKLQAALSKAVSMQHNNNSSLLQKFSSQSQQPRKTNSNRRRKMGGRVSANSSTATSNGYAARITTKVMANRRPIITKSTSATHRGSSKQKKHVRIKSPQKLYQHDDEYEDEGYVNDLQEDDVRHEEVKESIAKVRADIRKSLQVLELVKPLDDTANSWEEELKAFEAEEKRLHAGKEMQRDPSDEGRFSLIASPIDEEYVQNSVSVPAWNNEEVENTINSKLGSSYETTIELVNGHSRTDTANSNGSSTGYNSQLTRMLQQIQSDIKVKEELVSHLEKSETEFTFMRKKFDEKVNHLQSQLADTQKEKDMVMTKTKSGVALKSETSKGNLTAVDNSKQNLAEIRHSYENKMKNLLSEIQELKRKYSQATMTMQSTRNQNESLLRSLKVNVETLKVEKKRLVHRMKIEADRVREQISRQERKIQQLQRQHAKSNQAKKRLEHEHEIQKSTLKKRNEEVLLNASQLKQMTSIMKKAVREGGILDEKMLTKVTPIMGGSFAVIARGGGHGFPRKAKKKNPIPLGIRVTRKKQLLDKALYQYIQGKQAVVEMEQLLIRRETLVEEKIELEDERDQVFLVEKEHEEATGEPMDTIAIELMDERIDLISAEISYLLARIRTLQSEAAEEALQAEESGASIVKMASPRPAKHVTFADEIITEPVSNDEWDDVDAFDEQFSVPVNAAPEMAYDITSKLIKSLESDECKRIVENLVDDIMDLRMSECNRQVTVQNLEKTVIDLRRTLIIMKKTAISNTIENEKRIRHLEINEENMMDMMIHDDDDNLIEEFMNNGNTIFDKIYEDGVRGLLGDAIPDPSAVTELPVSTAMAPSSSSYHQQISLPNSPVASPPYLNNAYAVTNTNPPIPTQMIDNLNKSIITPRDSTPSPERFYNLAQQRLSWQNCVGGNETPTYMDDDQLGAPSYSNVLASSSIVPPEFNHYVTDHESSTSSIRSSHLRRSSIQSDMSSLSSWNQKTMMRGSSSHTAAAPLLPEPSRATVTRISPLMAHINQNNQTIQTELDSYENYQTPDQQREENSPIFTNSCLQQRLIKRPLPPIMPSASTFERPSTPTVFDRLAQTPTRASRAKMNYRHSSGSVDDLRRRWELDQKRPSSATDSSFF
ncbi:hypothetical protein INT47_003314 [Mucor saturninus]|uniref:Kinesin motor domain-containing protein n=1 Tax=Mucor saturninus TaxID=64648 RepID=A0A8H7RF76_9FUNG|nr:hypothetical protein INT47_003314 [Mucor saturninus]